MFRVIVGLVFLVAGCIKVRSGIKWFTEVVLSYQLVGKRVATLFAYLIPPLEIACGVSLIIGFAVRPTALFGTILLCIFSVALAVALMRGNKVNCGCFGNSVQSKTIRHSLFYRNVILIAMSMVVYYF